MRGFIAKAKMAAAAVAAESFIILRREERRRLYDAVKSKLSAR